MAEIVSNPPGSAPGDPGQPAPGQVSRLATGLAQKHGSTAKAAKQPLPPSPRVGTKGGRLTAQQETERYLAQNNLRAVPADQAPVGAMVAPAPPEYVVTPEFVGEVSEKLLKGVQDWRVSNREHRVFRLVGDKKLSEEFGESSKAPPGCIDTVSKSMMEIARKYPGILQWTPEIAAVAALGTWFAKDADVEKRLAKLEAMVREKHAPKPDAKP
jgi:hypothetical protein